MIDLKDARSRVPRRKLRSQAPERLQRQPRLDLEPLAREYFGVDFETKLLNDFNGGQDSTSGRPPALSITEGETKKKQNTRMD